MLLRHTEGKVVERTALSINPAKTCQPIGAMYAALGLHKCLPHSHGSQGCCSYHRSALTRHYKEPVVAGTSSFTEGASVFGGQANLLQAINNEFSIYNPDVIAVHTTCLSETIGDDIPQIAKAAQEKGMIPEGKYVIHCNTPSYVGSHVVGYSNMVTGFVKYFSEATTETKIKKQVNIIPGWIEPADMVELKSLVKQMGLDGILFPDTSGVLDAPLTGKSNMFPKGGARIEDIRRSGDSMLTVGLGPTGAGPAARQLDVKCNVPCEVMELPIGLQATDRFIDLLRKTFRIDVPEAINDSRGRLLDMISDMQQYTYGKTVALWGDPDQLVSLTEFLLLLGMKPLYVVTGTPGKIFNKRMAKVLDGVDYEPMVKQGKGADMYYLHQHIKQAKPDLMIGNTYGKYIARDEDIPFVRHGFPILDRVGHQYFTTVGYKGGIRLLEQILNAIQDRQDRDAPEESFELVM